jgi:NADH:ubiquinone oxidoreductase subunit 6 (subunit J)
MILALVIAMCLIVFGLARAAWKRPEKAAPLGLFLVVVYLGTLVTTFLVSLFLMPIFYSRYMLSRF